MLESERVHINLIQSPFSPYSLRARQALSGINYIGSWNLIENLVLPKIDQQCSELGVDNRVFLIFRWILLAATHPDIDATDTLKQVLATTFDMSCLDTIPNLDNVLMAESNIPSAVTLHWAYESPSLGDHPQDRKRLRENAKVILASRIPVFSPTYPNDPPLWDDVDNGLDFAISHAATIHASWLKMSVRNINEPDASVCIICTNTFEEIPCIVPNVCEHQYHFECLSSWQSRLKVLGQLNVECCYCRKMIAEGPKMVEENKQVSRNRKLPF